MNKNDLICSVSERAGLDKDSAAKAVNAVLDSVVDALIARDAVRLPGFGSFEVKERAARVGRNPQTKETIEIPASFAPVFKASKTLKNKFVK